MSLSVQQKQQHRWLSLKRFMTKVTKDSLSPTSWLLQQVDILHCHRLSKMLLISNSLIRQMWHEKVGFHKPALVKHTAERWWNAMWWGWHERLQRHQWRSHQLSESIFAHRWDVAHAHELTNTHTDTHTGRYTHIEYTDNNNNRQTNNRQAYKYSSISSFQHYILSCHVAFSLTLSLAFTYKHTATQVG